MILQACILDKLNKRQIVNSDFGKFNFFTYQRQNFASNFGLHDSRSGVTETIDQWANWPGCPSIFVIISVTTVKTDKMWFFYDWPPKVTD